MKKFSYDYVNSFFKYYGYELLSDEYIDSKSSLTFKDSENYFYNISFGNFKRIENNKKFKLFKFSIDNMHTFNNIKNWIKNNEKSFILESGEYFGNDIPTLNFRCLFCKNLWNGRWASIQIGISCPFCAGKRLGEKTLASERLDLIQEWDYENNNNLHPEQCFPLDSRLVSWICKDCGYKWKASISNRNNTNKQKQTNCPKCNSNSSKISNIVLKFLENNNIEFVIEKRFSNCKYKSVLPFDFYLPDYNCCIEVQGEHHYFPVRFGGKSIDEASLEFEKTKIKDLIKEDFCFQNKIFLLKISYWEFINTESILEYTLF